MIFKGWLNASKWYISKFPQICCYCCPRLEHVTGTILRKVFKMFLLDFENLGPQPYVMSISNYKGGFFEILPHSNSACEEITTELFWEGSNARPNSPTNFQVFRKKSQIDTA